MKQLIFSTGNAIKFSKGHAVCQQYDIKLMQENLAVDEVQSEDMTYVAQRKAEAAFMLLQKPVVITDDAWSITALNGFPGTYAKSINQWLTADDLLRLTKDLDNRDIVLTQTLVYQNSQIQKVFQRHTNGTLLQRSSHIVGEPIEDTISLDSDGILSVSEAMVDKKFYDSGDTTRVWHDFAQWFKELET